MKLLVVSPDYLSHALPMVQIGEAWRAQQGEVVVATGQAARPLVEAAELGWIGLRLGKGSNAGVIRVEEQLPGEDAHLRAFFDATRAGPIATLTHQAEARRHDLLFEPDRVFDRLIEIIDEVRPDRILVDHVAFGARLALHALGAEPATIVLGHPSALPAPDEVYGLPPEWPAAMRPDPSELVALEELCRASADELRSSVAAFLHRRAPGRPSLDDIASAPGHPTLYVYPGALHEPSRRLPPNHVFLGALRREETVGEAELPSGDGPRVTVALGSFLSARDDVLATAVKAARIGGWRLALAHGASSPDRLGEPPDGARVSRYLPQVGLLPHTDVLVHHGGNGSITEAAAAGVPMVVLPFSTDQFAGAAAIERGGLGAALAPNTLTAEVLVATVDEVLRSRAGDRAVALSEGIAATGGATTAVAAIAGGT